MSVNQDVKLEEQADANDPLARIRADLARQLACLNEPGAGAKLRAIFAMTPEEMAKAANAAALQLHRTKG